jgi:hypothetical protein
VELQTVATFKYLGIEICSQRGMQASPDIIRSAGLKAMWGLASQLQDREVSKISLKVQLFDSIVMPVLQYGCEVWSTQMLHNPAKPAANSVQQVQNLFLRQVTGNWVRKSVSTQLLCAEYGCRPVAWRWCKLVCRCWNRMPDTKYSLLRDAFREDLAHAVHLRPSSRDQSWCFEV